MPTKDCQSPTPRRTSLRWIATLVGVLGLIASVNPAPPRAALAADNAVVTENQQPGSNAWQLGSLVSDDVNGQIKGYASKTSVGLGQTISLYVTVNPIQTYTIDIYRIGWYGGLGGRLRLQSGTLSGAAQPPCASDATTGLFACSWNPSYTLTIPADWTSGVYLALLTNAAGYKNYIVFVVRDWRPAALQYQLAANTYQAYNDYPNDHATGKSLYAYNSYGANTVGGDARAVKVSFDRPYSGDGAGQFMWWEVNLVRWLERTGYDVTYTSDVDTHVDGAQWLSHSKGVIVSPHDEYWSIQMFDAVQAARDAGVSLAFLGANAIYTQVRFEPSASGAPDRVEVCYKDARIDPMQGPTTTVQWRYPPVNRPEQTLEGIQYTGMVNWGNNVGYVVTNSANWVYAGTGFKDGDVVPGLVGYEMDSLLSNYPAAPSLSQTLLSQSPFTDSGGVPRVANSSIYQATSGAWVFGAGTLSWAWGLENFSQSWTLADPRIQRTTANVLNAFILGRRTVNDLKVVAPLNATAGQPFSITVTAEDAQGVTVPWYSGTVHFSSSDSSPGVALPSDSTLSSGQGTFSATLVKAGPQTVTVSDAANSLSTTVNLIVTAAPASRLAMATAATTPTAGTSFSVAVTAQDPYGNADPSYAGTVHFASTDSSPGVALPPDSTLTNGQGTFAATLIRAGPQSLTASDAANAFSTTASLTVIPAPASRFAMATAATTPTAGNSFSFTVTALDPYGNTATNYAGRVHFTSTDSSPGVALPPDSTLSNGQRTFSATLDRAGSQTIRGADTATATIAGSVSVQVRPAIAATLSLSVPTGVKTNTAFNVTVTLTDRFGNVATGYTGTVHFTTSDLVAQSLGKMPADYTFTAGNAGTGSFSVTLVTPPSQTITVADVANPGLSATSPPIAVSAI